MFKPKMTQQPIYNYQNLIFIVQHSTIDNIYTRCQTLSQLMLWKKRNYGALFIGTLQVGGLLVH